MSAIQNKQKPCMTAWLPVIGDWKVTYFIICWLIYFSFERRRKAGTGHKLLTIIVRYAPILVSTFDPSSLVRRGGLKPLLTSLRLAVPDFCLSKLT